MKGSKIGRRGEERGGAGGAETESQAFDDENELPDLIMDIEDDVFEEQEYEESEVTTGTTEGKSRTFFCALAILGIIAVAALVALVVYFAVTYAGASNRLQTARDSLQNTTEYYLRLREQAKQREEQYCNQFRNSTEHWLHLFCEKYECPSRICDPGWQLFGRSCYLFVNSTRDWARSREACAEVQGHLVVVDSEKTHNFLAEHVKDTSYWIGMTDSASEGNWVWVDGSRVTDGPMFWARGQPDNAHSRALGEFENCGTLRSGRWFDTPCSGHLPSICEKRAVRLHLVFQRARRRR